MSFINQLYEKAKQDKKTIVLPESTDPRVLEAAAKILKMGIADVVLVGNPDEIKALAGDQDISGARIVDPNHFERMDEYADAFYELRKKKGITPEQAREMMFDVSYFGVMMVKMGDADGMVSGAVHSSADTLRPSLQILKTAPGTKLVSSFFLMVVPNCQYGDDGVFVFSDCGLVENPNAEELSEIALSAADTFNLLTGHEARVAMLSYSTKGSARNELVDKVAEATRLAKAKAPGLMLDGELQLDAAIVRSVGESKAPGSQIAGHANTLIFPNLDAGNIGYKLVQRLAGAEAYGPVTQGIAKPVNDLSRGCNADDIVGVTAITVIQAQHQVS